MPSTFQAHMGTEDKGMRSRKNKRPRVRQVTLFELLGLDPYGSPTQQKGDRAVPAEITPGMPPSAPKGKQNG